MTDRIRRIVCLVTAIDFYDEILDPHSNDTLRISRNIGPDAFHITPSAVQG